MRTSESRSKKRRLLDYSKIIITNRSLGSRLPKSLFCCVFGSMEERGALPKVLSTREKAGYPDSGSRRNVDSGPSWSVCFTFLPFDFFQSFIFARPIGLRVERISAPLFRTFRKKSLLAGHLMPVLSTTVSCHPFRATGITVYLENMGTLETAQKIAAHESPRTTKLYDRTEDQLTLMMRLRKFRCDRSSLMPLCVRHQFSLCRV